MRTFFALVLFATTAVAQTPGYVKKPNKADTIRATLAGFELPTLDGKWHYIGPFDNTDGAGFDAVYQPEKVVVLAASYTGKRNQRVSWKELPRFSPGTIYNLMELFPNDRTDACVYLTTEIETKQPLVLPLDLGSDDTLSVWLDRTRLLHENHFRAAEPDQNRVELRMSAGTHRVLIKVCQGGGEWKFYACPGLPDSLPAAVKEAFVRDFPPPVRSSTGVGLPTAEDKFYPVTTLPQPAECVLEVGGLGFRPDGKLLACTRRGEVWLIHNPGGKPADMTFTRFASGLHESLGLHVVDNDTVLVVQRPELTKLIDKNHDGVADRYTTVCDAWGVSGDYHEFAFGPAVDKAGNSFIALNVGFGGGHQAKSPWRGWCVKVSPDGAMEPWAYGLRSPNGIAFSPSGDLFYADNQGEWVATNKLNHIRKGQFYGHQAPLQWVKDSAFANERRGSSPPDKVASGMWYDGQNGGFPAVDPPAIWFPYGRMGQSVSEPVWDTTGGKFGPFAGQCFVGDQTRSSVMRVFLEQVNGVYQGACFPFRSGLQCGVNRLTFGPDGALYAGQTARGWGSVGGKPYGLQRLNFSGSLPFEVKEMKITPTGFDLTFTAPVDPSADAVTCYALKSFTYVYHSTYGCPETDTKPEMVSAVTVSKDRRTVSLTVPGRAKGRVYDLRLNGIKSATGEEVLHPEAFYTLNEVPKGRK